MNPKEDNGNSVMLKLKLDLSPVGSGIGELDSSMSSSLEMSPEDSCVSEESMECLSSSEEAVMATMLLGGCPRCLMYVMLSESDPKCPRCKSSVLLDFVNETNINKKSRN